MKQPLTWLMNKFESLSRLSTEMKSTKAKVRKFPSIVHRKTFGHSFMKTGFPNTPYFVKFVAVY